MSAAGTPGDLDANYARAGYHARQKWGSRPAIVLIDFANAYFDPASPLYGGEGCRTALDNAIKLAPAARAAGVPVIFTEVKYQAGGADGGAFFAKVPALVMLRGRQGYAKAGRRAGGRASAMRSSPSNIPAPSSEPRSTRCCAG